jgi:hypothetical protein
MQKSKKVSGWKVDPRRYNVGQLSSSFISSSLRETYENLFSYGKSTPKPVINLDWIELFGDGNLPMHCQKKNMTPDDYLHKLSDEVHLRFTGHGSKYFNAVFEIYMYGELFGSVLAHPKAAKKGFKETSFQLQVQNHMLYTDYWQENLNHFIFLLDLKVKSVTRCDIAIDGLIGVEKILNHYYKQHPGEMQINKIGRAAFTPHQISAKTMMAKSFSVGSAHSEKQISVYCKSDELEVSNKTYITKFWEQSGLKPEGRRIYRVEMRLKSKWLKLIKDFDMNRLTDKTYLASLFETGCKAFFQFTYNNDSRLDRQTKIQLIPFDLLGGHRLEKNKKPETTDRYKAKLAIHLYEKMLISGKVKDAQRKESLQEHVSFLTDMYDLAEWYSKKIEEWILEYSILDIKLA